MMNKTAARGPRPGRPDTRATILAVARDRFLSDGYQGVSMRSIAHDAGVDVALMSYYFGSKKGLFGAVLSLTANPAEILARMLPGDLAGLPHRLLTQLLSAWDSPDTGPPLQAALRAAAQDPAVAQILSGALEREIIDKLADRIGGSDAQARAGVFASHIAGLVFSRYVLCIHPIASMPADEIVRLLAPTLALSLRPPQRPPRRQP